MSRRGIKERYGLSQRASIRFARSLRVPTAFTQRECGLISTNSSWTLGDRIYFRVFENTDDVSSEEAERVHLEDLG